MNRPSLGVTEDRPDGTVDARAMIDCLNVRIRYGSVRNEQVGHHYFPTPNTTDGLNLDGRRVLGMGLHLPRSGAQTLVLGTDRDLYKYDEGAAKVVYLTPIYATGTITAVDTSTTVTGVGSLWLTNLKAGDYIFLPADPADVSAAMVDQSDGEWYEIDTITNDTSLELVTAYSGTGLAGDVYTARQTFSMAGDDLWEMENFPNALDAANADLLVMVNGTSHMRPALFGSVVHWDGIAAQATVVPDATIAFRAKYLIRWNQPDGLRGDLWTPRAAWPVRRTSRRPRSDARSRRPERRRLSSSRMTPRTSSTVSTSSGRSWWYGQRDNVNLVDFIGPDVYYAVRTALPGIGPLSGRLTVDFGDYFEFVANDSAYRWDGASSRTYGGQAFRAALRNFDAGRKDLAFAHVDEENGDVLWFLPRTNDPNSADAVTGTVHLALVEHYLEEVPQPFEVPFTKREMPNALCSGMFQRFGTLRFSDFETLLGTGTAGATSSTVSVNDAGGFPAANEWAGKWIYMTSGPAMGNLREIAYHSANDVVINAPAFTAEPDGGTYRVVEKPADHEFQSLTFAFSDRFFSGAYPKNLIGTKDGRIMELNSQESFAGSDYTSFARFARFPAWDEVMRGVVGRVEPYFTRRDGFSHDLTVRLLGADAKGDPLEQKAEIAIPVARTSGRFARFRNQVRYGSIELRTETKESPWDCLGLAWETVPGGER